MMMMMKEKVIDDNNETIDDLERQIAKTKENPSNCPKVCGPKKTSKWKSMSNSWNKSAQHREGTYPRLHDHYQFTHCQLLFVEGEEYTSLQIDFCIIQKRRDNRLIDRPVSPSCKLSDRQCGVNASTRCGSSATKSQKHNKNFFFFLDLYLFKQKHSFFFFCTKRKTFQHESYFENYQPFANSNIWLIIQYIWYIYLKMHKLDSVDVNW
ncbi:hypothetical protein RFI_00461 [Reticulomyxa filosa]|uniref:Uncharacterized protein n=1 Tax=Reticulomyxa filosa TaxID=46433 RepID=X6PFX6_RETFI|nr:hypothetical protein RFI_00461 [Reticulomyxa filosa]|eukprot:ETO36602.1 hypothetical protein RFI_00461 [Reticulomyxa filosa]